jgi:hypothetical protein
MNAAAPGPAGSAVSARCGVLAEMRPTVRPGVWVHCPWPRGLDVPLDKVVAVVAEDDGLSVVIGEARARRLQLPPARRCRSICLGLATAADAVGASAAVAMALAEVGIPCHVIAALGHDHLLVPVRQAASAVLRLQALARAASVVEASPSTLCGLGKPA